MASKLLSALGGAAAIHQGIMVGRDVEHRRARGRMLEERADEEYTRFKRPAMERSETLGGLEHEEKVRGIEEDRGAREAARTATAPATLDRAQPGATPGQPAATPSDPAAAATTLTGGAPAGSPAAPQQPAGPPKELWLSTAEAQRDYWIKQGRPERAAEVMKKAYANRVDQLEVEHKYKVQPQMQKIRESGIDVQQLQGDENYRKLAMEAATRDTQVAGLLWGMVQLGDVNGALAKFNASGVTLPGMKIAGIEERQTPNGPLIILTDEQGQVAKGKDGKPLAYPKQLLEDMHRRATTSNITLNKGQSVFQVQTGPGGTTTARPVVTAPDPEADRKAGNDKRTQDNRDRTLVEQRVRQARDAVQKQLFAGQTMMDRVDETKQKVHGIAAPIAEKYVRGGMDPGAAAQKAINDAEDQMKRDKAGAGPKARPAASAAPAAGASPTVADIIGQ